MCFGLLLFIISKLRNFISTGNCVIIFKFGKKVIFVHRLKIQFTQNNEFIEKKISHLRYKKLFIILK